MSVKSWVLDRVHRINGLVARGDLPPREPAHDGPQPAAPRSGNGPPGPAPGPSHAADAALSHAAHLGAYAALVGAIRDELEHFVASHVRLHLAIAEHDRFLLTSISVRCRDAGPPRQLLKEFMREFKPEQVKRYLAREVIAALPNAAAIELAQFAGLVDADTAAEGPDDSGEYRELLEALRSTPAAATLRPYEVSIVGRWAELDAARPAASAPVHAHAASRVAAAPLTPMAGQRCEFDLEDADGRRRVVLPAVVPGRRYVVGKGEACDIRVNATYASRRHAELWLENGGWWVADAGSTNGVRVEPAGPLQRGASAPVGVAPVRLQNGLRLVLSARAEGPAGEYPWLALRPPASGTSLVTPIATASGTLRTPRTAILAARVAPSSPTPTTQILASPPDQGALRLTLSHAAGVRTLPLVAASLPVSVGRSRHQTLVVDRGHEGVSGHHLDIVELDASGACVVVVHGDNGVQIDGARHPSGARVRWQAGQKLVLGDAPETQVPCVLELASPNGA